MDVPDRTPNGHFEGVVRNRARPEGSIAEAYIANEALTFCSRYMEDLSLDLIWMMTNGIREHQMMTSLSSSIVLNSWERIGRHILRSKNLTSFVGMC